MSARSASARKKATETHSKAKKTTDRPSRSRGRSGNAPDLSTHYEHYPPPHRGDGYAYDPGFIYPAPSNARRGTATMSISGHSNGSGSHSAPSEVDDGSGIERSGFRSKLDKGSDNVRKGLSKAFTFSKKEKEVEITDRPESAATVRGGYGGEGFAYDEVSPGYSLQQHPSLQQYPSYSQPSPHQLSPISPGEPRDFNWPGPPPSSKLPPIPQPQPPPMKRFPGGRKQATRWNKLRKDPELWDPEGDVLVYLGSKEHGEPPSLRLSSHVIEATRNRYLVTQLRDSFVDTPEDLDADNGSYWGQPTPPVSENDDTIEGDISYDLMFPPSPSNNRTDMIRHQITTRNVFALIYRAPLVGLSLHQALADLHIRLEKYHCTGEADPAAQVVRYITARSLDDVRNDPDAAVSILAWAEKPGVQWSAGWREAFVHCTGMYGQKLERCVDWKSVAPLTRALLERSWLEMRLRVQTAEERLAEFSYGDMWSDRGPSAGSTNPGTSRSATERLRNFLISHYGQIFGSWPPSPETHDGEEMWLTRTVVKSLQQDFSALYDYLVDRDVVWDVSEARAGRKWMMVSKGANMGFEADVSGMPMTDILIEYDNRNRVPHIPHPHPLLPESIPPQLGAGGGMFKSSGQAQRHAGRERRVALAYTESTNIDALDNACGSSLIDAFSRFEKSDCVGEVDPQTARRGRWVLIYGILQTLAALSVDATGIKYSETAGYHLSAKVKKPSWSREGGLFLDAKHEMSHCWTAPQAWEQEDDVQQDTPNAFSRSPPGMSTSTSDTGSSIRTSSSHAVLRQSTYGHEVELPLRRREMMVSRQESAPSVSSMGSFLALDDHVKRGRRVHDSYNETPLLNRGLSPVIRDFDAEP